MKKPAATAPNFIMALSKNLLHEHAKKKQDQKYLPEPLPMDVPTQLSLLLDREPCAAINFSVFAYLFDMIPKGKAYDKSSKEHSLLNRTIVLENTTIHIEQTPAAIIKRKGDIEETIFHYPGKQEEKVLDAIQFICLSKGNIHYDETKATFLYQITIHDIYKHLKNRGEMLNHRQIRDSLLIMHYSNITILSEDRRNRFGSTIIPDLIMNESSKPGRKSVEESTILLSFHVLYKLGIQTGNVVPFPDFVQGTIHRSLPLRILKILCFHFSTAGTKIDKVTHNEFLLDVEFVRDVSLEQLQSTPSGMKKTVGKELQYLKELDFIQSYTPEVQTERGKIVSCHFRIVATEKLRDIIKGGHVWYNRKNGNYARKVLGERRQLPMTDL